MDMNKAMCNLLDTYGHDNTQYGVREILNNWESAKGKYLLPKLSRHPNWDAENYRIVFSSDYNRNFDKKAVESFVIWLNNEIRKLYNSKLVDCTEHDEWNRIYRTMSDICSKISFVRTSCKEFECTIDGMSYEEYLTQTESLKEKINQFERDHVLNAYGWLSKEDDDAKDKITCFARKLRSLETNFVDEDMHHTVSTLFPDINCAVGTRITKVIRRICIKYGFDKVVNMQPVYDGNGNVVREKDMGYNGQIAALGDGINPLKIRRHTIISINPLDFLTMSFGHKWASCHTIDKDDVRESDNNYNGCYCSGTLSYMLDCSSVIFYTVDERYDGKAFETQDKMQRVMFHISEDGTVMIQGRVYPDGRDNGDASFAEQFRTVMQKVWSECNDFNNLWTLKRGTSEIRDYRINCGTNYKDYDHYGDCTISFLKGNHTYPKVRIGAMPICPNCGMEHHEEEWLCCPSCNDQYDTYCERCGNGIDRDCNENYVYCNDDGCYYCCEDCAEEAGVRYCEDDYEYHDRENWFEDDYNGCVYHRIEVETEDGCLYHSESNAENDGYMMTSNGLWYPEDDVYYDENRDTYFVETDDMVVADGNYFEDADSAREAGYIEYEGDWYSEDDMVEDSFTGEMFPQNLTDSVCTEDDVWFISKEHAVDAGYYLNIEGNWVKVEEEVA